MELGTFGAILRFAMDLEQQAAGFYEGAAGGELEEIFGELAGGSRKRLSRLERARREMVMEMILESITGLDGDTYGVNLDSEIDEAGLLRQAWTLEETSARFRIHLHANDLNVTLSVISQHPDQRGRTRTAHRGQQDLQRSHPASRRNTSVAVFQAIRSKTSAGSPAFLRNPITGVPRPALR